MESRYEQWIDGSWCPADDGGTWDVVDPATEEVVKTVPFGGESDCKRAIDAAERAFPEWSAKTPYERAEVLKRAAEAMRARAEQLAQVTVREAGKPFVEARGEWTVGADLFEWFAEEGKRAYGRTIPSRRANKRMLVLKQPIGVVGVITAWNFPVYNPARAWAAALAAGCTVVARPSEFTPMTAMEMVNILAEAGLPGGVLNLVNGDPGPMGQAMLDHPACRKISFTGSVRVGRILMDGASRTFTKLGLELGGNAPVLVLPDVDPAEVARQAAAARFRNCGQVCIAPQRFLVHEKVADQFTQSLVPLVKKLRVGPGLDSSSQVGPLINARQRDRVAEMVALARDAGGNVLTGGQRPGHQARGYFYEPTVVDAVQPGTPLFTDEIFGPVLPVTRFGDLDEAIRLANDTPYGLAAYVWTRDLRWAIRAYEGLEFGMVGVNEWSPHSTEAPFGGRKASGFGHESGPEGLAEYMETKLVGIGL